MTDRPTTTQSPGPKRPTLIDVARRANVAPVTVSRALNSPDLVNKETLARITDAINSLGYQMNPAARALAGSKWHTVGVVVPSLDHIMFKHQLSVFEAEITARGFSLLISATNYDAKSEIEVVRNLVTRGVDAILLTHLDLPEETLSVLDDANMPRVLMGSHGREFVASWNGYDDRKAMRSVVDHLVDAGHRDIGVLGDARAVKNGKLRVAAVEERLAEFGINLPANRIGWSGPDEAEARTAFSNLLASAPAPTAIICGNDDLAVAALAMARFSNIRVPEDLAITGFDGADITAHPLISLTTVRSSWRRMGKSAADQVIAAIEKRPATNVLVPTELIVRGSTKLLT